MKAEIHKEVKVMLTLSQKEAEWLQAAMQNTWLTHEPKQDTELRENLFTTLRLILSQDKSGVI